MAFTNIISGTIGGNGNIIYTNYSSKSNLQVRYDGTGDWLECSENANITGKSNCSFELKLKDGETLTTMQDMFWNCSSLTSLDLSNLDTSSVINMQSVFNNCSSLTSLNVSNFNTSQVTTMNSMFFNCSSLISLDLSSFNTSQVTNMLTMFYDCTKLTSLDLSNFDTGKVNNMNSMFYNCPVSDIRLLYATSSTINSLLTPLGTDVARNIYYMDAPLSELTVQDNITYKKYELTMATLPYTLNKLPNGVADYIDVVNKVYVQRVGVVEDASTLSWSEYTNLDNFYTCFFIHDKLSQVAKNNTTFLCIGVENRNSTTIDKSLYSAGNMSLLTFTKDTTPLVSYDIEGFKTKLAELGVKFLYELATPIYTQLTEEEIAQLPLSAYADGYVNLSSDQLTPLFEFRMRASNRYQVDMLETGYYYLNAPVGNVKLGTANVDVQQMPCIVKVDNVGTGDSGYRLGLDESAKTIHIVDPSGNYGYWVDYNTGELKTSSVPEKQFLSDFIEINTSVNSIVIVDDGNNKDVSYWDENKNFIYRSSSNNNRGIFKATLPKKPFKFIRLGSFDSSDLKARAVINPITLAKLPSHRIPTTFTQGMKCATDFGYWEGIKVAKPYNIYTTDSSWEIYDRISFGDKIVELNRIEYNNTIVEDEFDIATGKLIKRIGKTFIGYDEINSISSMSTDGNTYYCFGGSFHDYFPNWKSRGAVSVSNIKLANGHRQTEPSPVEVEFFMTYVIGFNFKSLDTWGNKKKILLNEMRRTGGFTVLYELAVPEISYIDLDKYQIKTATNGKSLQAQVDNYLRPQVKPSHLAYPVPSLVGNRTYTVVHNRKNITGSTKPIELNLGGTVVQLNDASSKTLVKTPSTLKHSSLIFIGGESTVDHVMVLDGDWTNKPIEYFENMKGHDTDAIITIIGDGKIDDVPEQYLW